MIKLQMPLHKQQIATLKAGQEVSLTGTIYAMRDKAHQKYLAAVKLPFDLSGQIIYYMGPTPTRPGHACGSCGPTTSSRMDKFTPKMISKTGIIGIIGKGARSNTVNAAAAGRIVYFITYSGLGALLAGCVTSCDVVCYKELGAEAVFKINVQEMPLIVAQDIQGNNIYGG